MEGCAFAMRDVITRLYELGVPARSILMVGGGAKSPLWGQIRADASGLPVHMAKHVDTCPVGAAVLASVAAGVQPNLARAAALVVGERTVLTPRPAHRAAYDSAYSRYRLLFEQLRPLYRYH
jgi:xylulokinase